MANAPAQFGSKRIMDMGTLSAHIKNALARSNHIGETLEPLHKKPPNQSGHQYRNRVDPHQNKEKEYAKAYWGAGSDEYQNYLKAHNLPPEPRGQSNPDYGGSYSGDVTVEQTTDAY